jgi:two-component system, sensor histidine kinase
MQGKIWVESEAGKGSTFHFTVKIGISKPELIEKPLVLKSIDDSQVTKTKLNILLAEDNLINQKVTTKLLTNLGHKVTIAENGKIAIDKLINNNFDLILMDIQMPEMDGLEATKLIRHLDSNARIPIVALTAHALKTDQDQCYEVGMDDFMTKPIDVEVLSRTLQKFSKKIVNV